MTISVRRTLRLVWLVALLAIVVALPAGAQYSFNNGIPDNKNGLIVNNGFTSANDFGLVSLTNLNSFDWYLLRLGSTGPTTIDGNFSWEILADVGGKPGGLALFSGSVTNATGTITPYFCCEGQGHDYTTYLFSDVSLAGAALGSGTYWLGVGGFSETGAGPFNYYWASSQGFQGNEAWSYHNGIWSTYHMEGAYEIRGTEVVPEPASLALLGTGLVGLIPALRRRFRV